MQFYQQELYKLKKTIAKKSKYFNLDSLSNVTNTYNIFKGYWDGESYRMIFESLLILVASTKRNRTNSVAF